MAWRFLLSFMVKKDYSQTIIGRSKRDYIWIMARSPSIDGNDYQFMLTLLADAGYDISRVEKVPQRW